MLCNDTATLLGRSRTTGFWDSRYDRLDNASHRMVTRNLRRTERRLLATVDMADPANHPEDTERADNLDWESRWIMEGNEVWHAWDHADRAEAEARIRAERIRAERIGPDPVHNDRCYTHGLPGWRGTSRYVR